jgi:hypothetical protein
MSLTMDSGVLFGNDIQRPIAKEPLPSGGCGPGQNDCRLQMIRLELDCHHTILHCFGKLKKRSELFVLVPGCVSAVL